nr:MAG TPA: hypothetical protein [Ackermannviridae sp.]
MHRLGQIHSAQELAQVLPVYSFLCSRRDRFHILQSPTFALRRYCQALLASALFLYGQSL